MDPFSIVVGTVSVADVCLRLVNFLKDVSAAAANVQQEIDGLINELGSLETTVTSVAEAFEEETNKSTKPLSPLKADNIERLWKETKRSLDACRHTTLQLDQVIRDIYGDSGSKVTGKIDSWTKESRRRNKATDLQRIREKLSTEKHNLQILLTGISLYHQKSSRGTLERLSKELRSYDQSFKSQIAKLEDQLRLSDGSDPDQNEQDLESLSRFKQFRNSVRFVTTAVCTTTPNEFFDIPQPVSSVYTGRTWFLKELQDILLKQMMEIHAQKQLRFVVYGIGGSGKTQFCSKFAEQNRESFWGIFWIDASTRERAKQTYAEIGKHGHVDPNQTAAMHWLSNREERWLLLIDNADDPHIELQEYFPKGDRGYIIITTRNPAHKVYGNVGPGYFEFQGMEHDDASALLLRTAQLAQPWDVDSSTWATKITKQLGFLALAVIHAGAAICSGLCTLKDYLTFYDKDWERIRRIRKLSFNSGSEDKQYMSALATYEVSYTWIEKKETEASKDAIQLLKMFSFFYYKNIPFDILRRAIVNCEIEKVQQQQRNQEEREWPLTWHQRYRNIRLLVLGFMMRERGPPVLPHIVRDGRESGFFDEVRVRYALRELVQMSLITYHESSDSYSMHPLVHKWARERPEMTFSDQAVWAEAANLTLAHSILLPPLGVTEADEVFRRDILPHIDHARSCQQAIVHKITENRKRRWFGVVQWPGAGSMFGPTQATLYAKFSLVFAQNGRWNDAEILQLAVKKYTDSVLGLDQAVSRRITLALALTYWSQGRGDEAADLQETVLQACMSSLGPNSGETLTTMDLLGQARWQQGRYSEARMLQQHAVDGLIKLRGLMHEDTLSAMGSLGRTIAKFYDNESLEEARRMLTTAFDGMSEILGPTHLKTLTVKEDLALLALQLEVEEQLPLAEKMEQEVLDCRMVKLGKENPYTLLAMAQLARIKTALGQHDEAKTLVCSALEVADRNLGERHIGTLMGRTVLGIILINQQKLKEAERTLCIVIENQRHLSQHRGDFHPDRLGAMIELARCYELQNEFDESIRLCDEIIEGLRTISLKQHPLERKMQLQKSKLLELKRGLKGRNNANQSGDANQ